MLTAADGAVGAAVGGGDVVKGKAKGGYRNRGLLPSKGRGGKGPGPPVPAVREVLSAEEQSFVDRFGMSRKSACLTGTYALSAHVPGSGADAAPLGADFFRSGSYVFEEATSTLWATQREDGAPASPSAERESEAQGASPSRLDAAALCCPRQGPPLASRGTPQNQSQGCASLVVGRFSAARWSGDRADTGFPKDAFDSLAEIDMPCIEVVSSEIMAEIQNPANDEAYFVLPSQLNGAEYPSHVKVVGQIEDYKSDNTGGPRGQLAVHPAAGQFMLDNASCNFRTEGINAVDVFLGRVNAAILEAGVQGQKLGVTNGYLTMPTPHSEEAAALIIKICRANAHTLRPLVMTGLPASGLRPDKGTFSSCTHSTHLFYASAVPINRYTNGIGVVCKAFGDEDVQRFQLQIAEAVLVAQYYGALQTAARHTAAGRKAKVFLMPLGGGVFNNPWEVIVKAMALATELLAEEERSRLDIKALAFDRGTTRRTEDIPERVMLTQLLRKHRKLAGGGHET